MTVEYILTFSHTEQPRLPFFKPKMPSPADSKRRIVKLRGAKLCARCSKINLEHIFSARPPTIFGRKHKKLPPLAKWSIGSCSLCTLLVATLWPQNTESRSELGWQLRSFASAKVHHLGWDVFDTAMIAITTNSSISVKPFRRCLFIVFSYGP